MPFFRRAGRPHQYRSFLVVVGFLTATCDGGPLLPPSGDTLAPGTWGGDNAAVIVTDSATHLHVGCTFGDIRMKIPLDADGRFRIDGSYMLRAYPIPIGPELPAQFSGRVVGRTLTLAIAVNDTVEKRIVVLGPVTVVYRRAPSMGPCPICRVPPRMTQIKRHPQMTQMTPITQRIDREPARLTRFRSVLHLRHPRHL